MEKVKVSRCGCVTFALCFFALVCGGSSCSSRNPNPNPPKDSDPEIDDYDIHPTINGGIEVNKNDPIPYQLRIKYINPENGQWRHICGAVILDEKTAITAAHCFDRIGDRSRLQVVAGDFLLDEHETTEQVKKINKIIIHPAYTDFRHGSDIAILHVEELAMHNYAQEVWLSHSPAQNLANLSAVISGWGMVSDGAPASNSLQKGNVRILPPQDCLQRLTNRMKVPVRRGIVCAHDPTTRTCSGDSGGPLVIQNDEMDGSFGNLLVGITSFAAKNCSRQDSAGAFTEISRFYDWIQANRDPSTIWKASVDPSEPTPIPYQLSIQYKYPEDPQSQWRHLCSAVIIDENTAITAAHCFGSSKDLSRYHVVAGENNVDVHNQENEQILGVKKLIIHPNFTDFKNGNDIAILHVDKLQFNEHARPVFLSPVSTESLSGLKAVISGWAVVSDSTEAFNSMKKGVVSILSPQDCLHRLTHSMKVPVRQGIVCAMNPLTRTCVGSSGGPLVIQNYKVGDSSVRGNLLVGIITFGPRDCQRQNKPTAFTEISHFYEWIQENRF